MKTRIFMFLASVAVVAGILLAPYSQMHTIEEPTGTAYALSIGPDSCFLGFQTGHYFGPFGSCSPYWEFGVISVDATL